MEEEYAFDYQSEYDDDTYSLGVMRTRRRKIISRWKHDDWPRHWWRMAPWSEAIMLWRPCTATGWHGEDI